MYTLLAIAIILGVIVFAANGFVFSEGVMLYAVSVGVRGLSDWRLAVSLLTHTAHDCVFIQFQVSIIPEGLPAVLVVVMSQGVARMAKQKAIVRKIASLEALGKVTNICSDK